MTRGRIVVVGLGPAGPELVTQGTLDALERIPHHFVRTLRHPSASLLAGAHSFDGTYDGATTFDEVYGRIVDSLVESAVDEGEILYAVPGSPRVAERTVELLEADDRVDVTVLPALSFFELACDRLRVDPLAAGVRLIDGRRFDVEAAGERGPLLVAQCDTVDVLSDVKLAVGDADPDATVTVVQRLGLPDEVVREVHWSDLDREIEPDHLTSIWIPSLAAPVAMEVARFDGLVHRLRRECPWDKEQTHRTLTRHLLEETYEVLEAIEQLDGSDEAYEHLEEELGDLLFQVVFHATLAGEEGRFTLADVARHVHDKLVVRHPHVFGDVEADTPDRVMRNWEQIKKQEKGHASVMDGIPGSLPSLLFAHKVQRKAASLGIEVPGPDPALAADEIGGALFALVAAARVAEIDPETALRAAAAAFRDEVKAKEAAAETSPGGLPDRRSPD